MCRRNVLQGWCMVMLGLGLMVGNSVESWFFCAAGGLGLVGLGFGLIRKK